MADVKVSGLPSDSSLDGNHYVPLNDPTGPTTKRTLLSTLAAFFFNQTNIPDGTGSPRTRDSDRTFDNVTSGLVWSGDSYGSNRNASMTSGVLYIAGRRISLSAVVARTFTASKDTYIDVKDNGDGTGTIIYTEVANGAASPSALSNGDTYTSGVHLRIGKIVTGATTIANAAAVVQSGYDSLGNTIFQDSPFARIVNSKGVFALQGGRFSTTSTSYVDVTGCSMTYKTGAKPERLLLVVTVMGSGSSGNSNEVTVNIGGTDQDCSTYFDGAVYGRQAINCIYDAPANTTLTIKIRSKSGTGASVATVNDTNTRWMPNVQGYSKIRAS